MYSNRKFINWQIENKLYLISIFNMIKNNLKKNNIKIINEEKLRINLINYIYSKI
jgi:hypothetical protein